MTNYLTILAAHGGVLAHGAHRAQDPASCPVCVLELAALKKLGKLTDSPGEVGLPDIRGINDAYLDDARRTAALLPWLDALDGWSEWPEARRIAWTMIVSLRTIREILPIALDAAGLPDHAKACRAATDLVSARASAAAATVAAAVSTAAAVAATEAAYIASAYATNAAYDTDEVAAFNASYHTAFHAADRHRVLDLAVQIQIEAAAEVG